MADKSWEPVEVEDVECVEETDGGALKCCLGSRVFWVPKSVVHDNSEVWEAGQRGTLVIPEWLALQKELI